MRLRGSALHPTIAVLTAAGLAACATPSDIAKRSQIVAGSPVDKAIADAQAHPGPAPTFAQFPKKPTGMRPPSSWSQSESSLKVEAAQLAVVADSPPEIADPETYGKQLRAQSGLDQIEPPGPNNTAEIEAYARELRERATPPPPPK
ncbi:MAG TPA: hypothetical protein VFN88_09015 [Caulobacteraceae bacterium]|nr:hypothetical protein [Caulobacteraceae bacterium]